MAMVAAVAVVAVGATKEEIITLIWIAQRVSMVEGTLEAAVEGETGTLAVVVAEEVEIIIANSGIMETGIIGTEWTTGTMIITVEVVVVVWTAWNAEEETILMVEVTVAATGTFTNGYVLNICDVIKILMLCVVLINKFYNYLRIVENIPPGVVACEVVAVAVDTITCANKRNLSPPDRNFWIHNLPSYMN